MIPIRAFTIPIWVFTMGRPCCSRWADLSVHDAPIRALKDKETTPFTVESSARSLSSVLGFYADRLRQDVYSSEHPVDDKLRIRRHLVICLSRISGPVATYRRAGSREPEMSDADRTLLHSILYGRPVSLDEWAAEYRDKKVLFTRYRKLSFALTRFEEGTLIFLQHSPEKEEGPQGCLAANVRSCSMTVQAFLDFIRETEAYEGSRAKAGALRKEATHVLQELRGRYTNSFCQSLYAKHSLLRTLIGGDKDS